MNISKKNLTPIALVSIFLFMLGLSFAAVPLYDLFCRVTGFGGTTQNATEKEIPKIIVNQDYKMRFDTNINSTLDWKFYPCLLYTSPSPRDRSLSRMPSSA